MNIKNVLIIALFCLSVIQLKAQDEELKKKAAEKAALKNIKDTGWIKGGFFSTNISNTTFSNWSQGGTNNTGLISNANLFAIYHPANDKYIWENYLELAYGVIRNGESTIDDPSNPGTRVKKIHLQKTKTNLSFSQNMVEKSIKN